MKHTGIWLDKDRALVVTLENNGELLQTITSNIDHYNPSGGSGTRLKGGPQNVVQDSKYLEREKQQFKHYFKNIVTKIDDTDALVIFGPAGTNEKFSQVLHDNYGNLSKKIKGVKKADSMTENQFKALVKDFFKLH